MTLLDIAFLIGAVAGPVVAVACCALVLATTRRRAIRASVLVLGALVGVAFVVFWFFWGEGFDAADAYVEVPQRVRAAQDAASVVGALATLALVVLSVAVLVRSRAARAGRAVGPRAGGGS